MEPVCRSGQVEEDYKGMFRDARSNLGATDVTFDKRSKTMPNSITKGTVTEEEINRMVWKAFGEKALEIGRASCRERV